MFLHLFSADRSDLEPSLCEVTVVTYGVCWTFSIAVTQSTTDVVFADLLSVWHSFVADWIILLRRNYKYLLRLFKITDCFYFSARECYTDLYHTVCYFYKQAYINKVHAFITVSHNRKERRPQESDTTWTCKFRSYN